MADNIKVAVRMRPFNTREKDRSAGRCIDISANTVRITDPTDSKDTNEFCFDYCYDSFDAHGPNFASQAVVFKDLGTLFLENCWGGYNSTLFAYGQTGAGKSYSMMGAPDQPGIIPLGCQELFRRIQENTDESVRYLVQVSFLEIYNESLSDLLNPKSTATIRIREHPVTGITAEPLEKIAVTSYDALERIMEKGTAARTVAATNMNATSSRSHSVFTVYFTRQQMNGDKVETTRTATVNLVDLAGSERQDQTGAEGQRLREACAINKSLSALGNVISALADKAKGKKVFIPYRDSVLTRLLTDALGGNAKTIMIAAVSPADLNYSESLSTLRYADRAKQIVNTAKINESPQDKLVRELKEEIERLRASGAGAGSDELRSQLEASQKALDEATEDFEQKLARAAKSEEMLNSSLQDSGLSIAELGKLGGSASAQLMNLSPDAMLAGNLVYFIRDGATQLGTGVGITPPPQFIRLTGAHLHSLHASISAAADNTYTIALADKEARVFINGQLLGETEQRILRSGDRVIFGHSSVFRFVNTTEAPPPSKSAEEQWEEVMNDLAIARGDSQQVVSEELVTLSEEVDEANDISKTLEANIVFAVDISYVRASETESTMKRVLAVTVVDIAEQAVGLWDCSVFRQRLLQMRQLLATFQRTGEKPAVHSEDSPFYLAPPDVQIGVATTPLQALVSETGSIDAWLPVMDEKSQSQIAELHVQFSATPPNEDGYRNFEAHVTTLRGIKSEAIRGMWCRFDFPSDGEMEITERVHAVDGTADLGFNETWQLPHSEEWTKYLQETTLRFEVFGYIPRKPRPTAPAVASTVAQGDDAVAVGSAEGQASLAERLRLVEEERDKLLAEKSVLASSYQATEQETSQLRSRLRQALPKLKQAVEFRERIAQLEAELQQKSQANAGHVKLEEEKTLLTAQIQLQEKETKALREEVANYKAEIEGLRTSLRAAEERGTQEKDTSEALEESQNTIRKLEAQIAVWQESKVVLEKAEADVKAEKQRAATITAELEEERRKNESLTQQLSTEKAASQAEVAQVRAEFAEQKKQLEQELEQTRGELKERPSTAAEDMVPRAEHEKQTSTLSQQLQQAEAKIQELTESHQQELEKVRAERPPAVQEDMVPRSEHEKETSALSQHVQQAEAKIQELTESLRQKEAELQQEKENSASTAQTPQQDGTQHTAQREEDSQQVSELKATIARYEAEMAEMRQQLSSGTGKRDRRRRRRNSGRSVTSSESDESAHAPALSESVVLQTLHSLEQKVEGLALDVRAKKEKKERESHQKSSQTCSVM